MKNKRARRDGEEDRDSRGDKKARFLVSWGMEGFHCDLSRPGVSGCAPTIWKGEEEEGYNTDDENTPCVYK